MICEGLDAHTLRYIAYRHPHSNMICSAAICNAAGMDDQEDFTVPAVRLKWARSRLFKSAADFARKVGLEPVTYRAYENDQNGFADHAPDFAKRLGVPTDWLLRGGPLPELTNHPSGAEKSSRAPDLAPTRVVDGGDTADIIQLDLSLPMGPGAEIDDYIEEVAVRLDMGLLRSFTRSPFHRLRLLKGIGDSMEPLLKNGDLVLIDTTYTQLDFEDKIWAVRIRGLGAVKRLRSAPKGKVRIISDNPAIPNDTVDANEIAIMGRVVGAIRAM